MKAKILACHQQIQPYIHRTPVLTSRLIDEIAGAQLFFKCENFQKTGAFKMRGALYALLQLSPEQRQRGVVTHSSGNFAQAVSFAAKNLGIPAYIVMPHNAPQVKKDAVKSYGGQIIECAPNIPTREAYANKIIQEKGATLLHPSNQLHVIIGQATAGYELLQEQPDLEALIAPIGGGGFAAGTALAAHHFGQNCRAVAGEPLAVDDAYRSLQSGVIETNTHSNTIADGLRTQLGDVNFPILQQHLDRVIRVSEAEIIAALRLLWQRLKIVCEPSSAVALAAVLKEKEQFRGQKVGVLISGGNVDVAQLAPLFT